MHDFSIFRALFSDSISLRFTSWQIKDAPGTTMLCVAVSRRPGGLPDMRWNMAFDTQALPPHVRVWPRPLAHYFTHPSGAPISPSYARYWGVGHLGEKEWRWVVFSTLCCDKLEWGVLLQIRLSGGCKTRETCGLDPPLGQLPASLVFRGGSRVARWAHFAVLLTNTPWPIRYTRTTPGRALINLVYQDYPREGPGTGTRTMTTPERALGVPHHLCVSIDTSHMSIAFILTNTPSPIRYETTLGRASLLRVRPPLEGPHFFVWDHPWRSCLNF